LLGLELTPARTAGYDAVRASDGRRFQFKGRCLALGPKPGQRLGSIDVTKDFDAVLLVLMDSYLDAIEIFEADRGRVVAALTAPGSVSCNERGALGIGKFKQIGRSVRRAKGSSSATGNDDQNKKSLFHASLLKCGGDTLPR
jgi:hypothetical protein